MIFLLLGICSLFSLTDGACTFPSALEGLWTSSHNGDVTFNSTHVSYPVEATGGNLIFECYGYAATKYLLKSQVFPLFSSYAMAVMCMDLTEVKTNMYQMNIYTSKLADANYQRVKYVTTSTTVTDAVACDNTANTDYHLLIKNGSLSDVTVQCPDILLGSFSFTFNDTSCVNDTGSLDVCTDIKLVTLNYTACSTKVAYSADGSLNCVHSSTVGSAQRIHLYNLDSSTDESTYYRFTCLMLEYSGDRVIGTQHPQDCLSTQTTSSVDSPGGTLNMTASTTCVPVVPAASTVATAAIVAGVLVGLFVLTVVGLIIGYFCWKAKCKKEKVEPRKGLPPTSTGDEDMVSDVTVISIGQENGENGVETQQHLCPNLRPTENAFQHNDGILGQTRMVLAKQCEHKSLPEEELNTDKNIIQSRLTKKSMVARLISFFSFNKSDSTSKLLIKSNERGKQKIEKESSASLDVESAVENTTKGDNRHEPEFVHQAEESTLTVTKQIKIDINISMKSAVTTIIKENPVSKPNSCDRNTCIILHDSPSCLADTTVTNELQHDTVNHIANIPPAEIHVCSETNDKKTNYSSPKLSHCKDNLESELISNSKNHVANANHSTIVHASPETQPHIVSIRQGCAVSDLFNFKPAKSSDHVNTEFPFNKHSEAEGNMSKNEETLYDLESNTTKKTDSPDNVLQRDDSKGNVTLEEASGMQHIKTIDNTTNSIPNQKTPADKYVDLQISETTEERSKSNALTRSEKITNNQSCFTSVSAKPSDKSLIIESGSLRQSATTTVQSRSAAEPDDSHTLGHFSDTSFLSHQLLQNQIRVLDPSNYNTGNMSGNKLDESESCTVNEVKTRSQKPLHLLINETKIECDNIASNHGNKRQTTEKEIKKSTTESGDQSTKPSSVMDLRTFPADCTRDSTPHVQEESLDFGKISLHAGDQSSECPPSSKNDSLELNGTSDGTFAFNKEPLCIPNPNPPIAHAISETKLLNPNRNDDNIESNENSQFQSYQFNHSPRPSHDAQSMNSNHHKQQCSKRCDIIELRLNKSNDKENMKNKESSMSVELKCNISDSSKINQVQSNLNLKTKKPTMLSKISANTDLLKQKTTPRGGSKAPDLLASMKQTTIPTKDTNELNAKITEIWKESVSKTQTKNVENNQGFELNMDPNVDFSESLDSSSENEDIRVEEFSIDDTEDDTWSLATFAIPTKLEMDHKEMDIPMNYYKRKRFKKKSKGYFRQFYQNSKNDSQNIDNLEIKKPVDLPFLKYQISNRTASKENTTGCGFDEKGEDIQPPSASSECYKEQTEEYLDLQTRNVTENKKTLPNTGLSSDPLDDRLMNKTGVDYDKNDADSHRNIRDRRKRDETEKLPTKSPKQDKLEANARHFATENQSDTSTSNLHTANNEQNLESNDFINTVYLEPESQVTTVHDDAKSNILPDIRLKEKSAVSVPKPENLPNTKTNFKTTKMSSLLSKTESMSLPKVSDGIKKVFTFKESREKSKSKGQEKDASQSKDTKTKSSPSKGDKEKKKAKKVRTTKFSRNLSFIKPREKPVQENYEKFGEKEEKLRDEKPNKFRFDQLPTIRKSKPKEKHQGSKKATKNSSNEIGSSVNAVSEDELKLPAVGIHCIPDVHEDTKNSENDKDFDNKKSEQESPLPHNRTSKQEKKPKQKRKRKKKNKKVKQSKEVSSEIDSDEDVDIDPSVYFTSKAGNSSRPNSSHELPQLISKIKLTASCVDIRSLCGDLD